MHTSPNTPLHVKPKVDDREALGSAGSSNIHGQSEGTNGVAGGAHDAQADKPGQKESTADLTSTVVAGEGAAEALREGSADAPADVPGPGSIDEGRPSGGEDEAAGGIVEGGEDGLDPGSEEEEKGFDEEKAEEVWEKGMQRWSEQLWGCFWEVRVSPA